MSAFSNQKSWFDLFIFLHEWFLFAVTYRSLHQALIRYNREGIFVMMY